MSILCSKEVKDGKLRGEGEEDREWQPHSEVCKRGTQVVKMVGVVVMAIFLLAFTWMHWNQKGEEA